VVAFNWVASAGFPSTNMTTQLANYLLSGGSMPVAMFTGNSSDATSGAWLLGRNIDSGTRLTALAEAAYGTTVPVIQYAVGTNYTMSNGVATITGSSATNNIFQYPIESINGVSSQFIGNSGYSSGGTLCGFMTNVYASGTNFKTGTNGTVPSGYTSNNYLIGYAGTSDANGKTNSNSAVSLIKMNWNGVANSTTAIAQGQYTFWGYEHLYIGASANADTTTVCDGVATIILATPTTGGTVSLTPNVNLTNMVVGRNIDGGIVYPNY